MKEEALKHKRCPISEARVTLQWLERSIQGCQNINESFLELVNNLEIDNLSISESFKKQLKAIQMTPITMKPFFESINILQAKIDSLLQIAENQIDEQARKDD